MRETGCVVDPSTNSYCYVSAAVNTNPSDLYFYQLPLGITVPTDTTISCSSCTKTLMGLYDAALTSSNASTLGGLQKTYNNASISADKQCGQSFSQQVSSGSVGLQVGLPSALSAVAVIVLFAGWSISP